MKKSVLPQLTGAAIVFAAWLFAGAGCGSAPAPRDLMVEEARADKADRPIAMKGESTFDGGKIQVVATVSRGFERSGRAQAPAGERRGRRWGNKERDAFSERFYTDYGESEEEQKEAIQEYLRQAMARRAAGSPMPPVTLRVAFQNRGAEPLEIVPTEVNSDLGNFAVRPPKLTLAPGDQAVLDPMVSQLGVMSDEIPLTVSARIGDKTETQVILIKNILASSVRK